MKHGEHAEHQSSEHGKENHYRHLAIMALLSFVAMYVLMSAMVDGLANVYMNVNQVYMAALMAAPMVLIELAVMRGMYRDRKRNMAFVAGAVVLLAVSFPFIRRQTAVGDRQFLRSMIPHHASALLMCREAPISDAEIKALCQNILASQQAEIDQMKAMLARD